MGCAELVFISVLVVLVVAILGGTILFALISARKNDAPGKQKPKCPVCQCSLALSNRCLECGWSKSGSIAEFRLKNGKALLSQAFHQNRIDQNELRRLNALFEQTLMNPPISFVASKPAKTSSASADAGVTKMKDDKSVIMAELVEKPRQKPVTSKLVRPSPKTISETPGDSTKLPSREFVDSRPHENQGERVSDDIVFLGAESTTARATSKVQPSSAKSAVPRRTLQEFMSAFMEEKNIRWGELVGGILIISCSIALVISFWTEIASQPLLKFGVFTGVTASLFGLGLHAAQRWRLPNTSHGILIIAMLLVPLNFLAMASFTEASSLTVMGFAGEILTMVVFWFLSYQSAKVFARQYALLTASVVVALSAYQLLVRRFILQDSDAWVIGIVALIGIGIYLVSALPLLRPWIRGLETSESESDELLTLQSWKRLGVTSFAFILAAGFFVTRTIQMNGSPDVVSPLLILVCVPVLLCGSFGWIVGTKYDIKPLLIPSTSIFLSSMLIIAASLIIAWPSPTLLLATLSLVILLSITCLTSKLIPDPARNSILMFVALVGAGITILAASSVSGRLPWSTEDSMLVLKEIVSFETGYWLIGYAVAGFILVPLLQLKSSLPTSQLSRVLSGLGVAGLILITIFGFGNRDHIVSVSLAYFAIGLAAILARHIYDQATLHWLTIAGISAAIFQIVFFGLLFEASPEFRWLATLAVCSIATTVLVAFDDLLVRARLHRWPMMGVTGLSPEFDGRNFHQTSEYLFLHPLHLSAIIVVIFTTIAALAVSFWTSFNMTLSTFVGLAPVWFFLSYRFRFDVFWSVGQWVVLIASMTIADQILVRGAGSGQSMERMGADWLQIQGCVIVLSGISWSLYRIGLKKFGSGNEYVRRLVRLSDHRFNFDQIAISSTIILLTLVCLYAAMPGMLQELTPVGFFSETNLISVPTADGWRLVPDATSFELMGWDHHQLGGGMMPGLLIVAIASVGILIWEKKSIGRWILLLLASYAIVFLLAAQWESTTSVASALRWILSVYFFIGCIGLWTVQSIRQAATGERLDPFAKRWLCVLGLLCFLPLAVMASSVAGFALSLKPPSEFEWQLIAGLGVLLVVGLATGVTGRAESGTASSNLLRRTVSMALAILLSMPVVAYLIFLVGQSLGQHPVTGPNPGTIFESMGRALSYSVPIFVIAFGLMGTAIRLRNEIIGLIGGIFLNLSGTAAFLLVLGKDGFNLSSWIQLAEFNGLIASVYGLGWLYVRRQNLVRISGSERPAATNMPISEWLSTQTYVAFGFIATAVAATFIVSFANPIADTSRTVNGSLIGWLGLIATVGFCQAAGVLRNGRTKARFMPVLQIGFFVLLVGQLQTWVVAITNNPWAASYLLMAAVVVSGFMIPAWPTIRFLWHRKTESEHGSEIVATAETQNGYYYWTLAIAVLIMLMAFRMFPSPDRSWPTVIGIGISAMLFAFAGFRYRKPVCLWVAQGAIQLATCIGWVHESGMTLNEPVAELANLLLVNVIALTLPMVIWTMLEKSLLRRSSIDPWTLNRQRFSLPEVVSILAVALLSCVAFGWTALALLWESIPSANPILMGLAALSVLFAIVVCYRRSPADWIRAALFVTGVGVTSLILQWLGVHTEQLTWCLPITFAGFSLLASYLISRRHAIVIELTRAGLLPKRGETREPSFPYTLYTSMFVIGCFVVVVAFVAQFRCDHLPLRGIAANSILVQALAMALLVQREPLFAGNMRQQLSELIRSASLSFGLLGCIAIGWTFVDPWKIEMIDRTTIVALVSALVGFFYGFGLVKIGRLENWIATTQRFMPWLFAISAMAICSTIGFEVYFSLSGAFERFWLSSFGIISTLIILFFASLYWALLNGPDAFGLDGRKREIYIYSCQVILALLIVHLRVSMPQLFSGWLTPIWPLLLILFSFAMLGIGIWSDRQKITVIANPLKNTGAMLPLVPILAYWLLPSAVSYSLTLLAIGIGYGLVSWVQKSKAFALAAVVAINVSFWYLLHDQSIYFLLHPQIWLIPPGILILIAAQLNKGRLGHKELTTIRYAASAMIYIASTAEIMIHGVGNAPWLPIVLAGISIAGIGVGIGLRIRAFLWMGISFLSVALLTVIWFAAVDRQQTWIWYVTGIAAGVAIIAIFAIFEKRRNDLLIWFGQLRHWES